MIIKAYFDTSDDFYPVYWNGKKWVQRKESAKVYKRFPRVVSKFSKAVYQSDNNIHSVQVR